METKITIYGREDLKKSGGFKKKNNVLEMNKETFFKYLRSNNLGISYGYIDLTGNIGNGKIFKCSCNNLIVGVSSLVKEFNA